jgi:DnaJ-class molecular chaperone
MTYAGIEIQCSDDLDRAADRMADLEPDTVECPECRGAGEVWDYSPTVGELKPECPCCLGDGCLLNVDDEGWDPDPPTPAAPALVPCRDGGGDGTRRMQTGDRLGDWVEIACRGCEGTGTVAPTAPACPACDGVGVCPRNPDMRCWYCDGSGVDEPPAAPPAARRFDRAAHCQAIASGGGARTVALYGVQHMRTIGKAGARATIKAHGVGYWRGLGKAKGSAS